MLYKCLTRVMRISACFRCHAISGTFLHMRKQQSNNNNNKMNNCRSCNCDRSIKALPLLCPELCKSQRLYYLQVCVRILWRICQTFHYGSICLFLFLAIYNPPYILAHCSYLFTVHRFVGLNIVILMRQIQKALKSCHISGEARDGE